MNARLFWTAAVMLLLAACKDSVEPLELAGPPASTAIAAGDNQRGVTNAPLAQALTLSVTDAAGKANPGVEVTWTPGAGTMNQPKDTTDAAGQSKVTWTLPPTPGIYTATATVAGLPTMTFTATAQPVAGDIVFRFIDAGGYHGCGITTSEQLLCWGYNADGQLGLGSTTIAPTPTLIPGDFRYRMVSGGYYHSCGFTLAGNAWCWGNNSDGRLGDGSVATQSEAPVKVLTSVDTLILGDSIVVIPGPQLTTQVLSAGRTHTCGIDLSQHPWCWGDNEEGALGIGELGPSNHRGSAVPVLTDEPYKDLAVGGLHTCGVTVAGDARCWGYNVGGQVGDGTTASKPSPTAVGIGMIRTDPLVIFHSPDPDFPLPPGPFIAAGYDHSCAITTAGPTVCWGLNEYGQLGDGSQANRASPATVAGGHAFAAVTAGLRHSCGLDNTGAAWCWGDNTYGELGDGTQTPSATPVAVGGGLLFSYIKAGELSTCGVTGAGVAYCWGDNEYGQLGDGTATSSLVPVKVAFQP
jgi:alpha-tubulin suppressor-like RCC1 family protein